MVTLLSDKCQLIFNLTNYNNSQAGWYGGAIQIEDFMIDSYDIDNNTSPLSSIPLAFLVKIVPASKSLCTYM